MGGTNFTIRSLEGLQKYFKDGGIAFYCHKKPEFFLYLIAMRGFEQKYKPDRLPNDRDKILKEKIITKIIWSHCLI